MLQQYGDVVYEIRTVSKPSTVVRCRHTWKSAVGLGVSAAFLGLSLWFDRTADDDFTRSAAAVSGLIAHLISGRWRVEERQPLPKSTSLKRAYRLMQGLDWALSGLIVAMTYWIGFTGAGGRFWLAFTFLIPSACAGALLLERGYRRLFAQIAAAKAD